MKRSWPQPSRRRSPGDCTSQACAGNVYGIGQRFRLADPTSSVNLRKPRDSTTDERELPLQGLKFEPVKSTVRNLGYRHSSHAVGASPRPRLTSLTTNLVWFPARAGRAHAELLRVDRHLDPPLHNLPIIEAVDRDARNGRVLSHPAHDHLVALGNDVLRRQGDAGKASTNASIELLHPAGPGGVPGGNSCPTYVGLNNSSITARFHWVNPSSYNRRRIALFSSADMAPPLPATRFVVFYRCLAELSSNIAAVIRVFRCVRPHARPVPVPLIGDRRDARTCAHAPSPAVNRSPWVCHTAGRC